MFYLDITYKKPNGETNTHTSELVLLDWPLMNKIIKETFDYISRDGFSLLEVGIWKEYIDEAIKIYTQKELFIICNSELQNCDSIW